MATETINILGESVNFEFTDENDLIAQAKEAEAQIRNEQLSTTESATEALGDFGEAAALGLADIPLSILQTGTDLALAIQEPTEGAEVAGEFQQALTAETQKLIDGGMDFNSAFESAKSNVQDLGIADPSQFTTEGLRRSLSAGAKKAEGLEKERELRSPIASGAGEIVGKIAQTAGLVPQSLIAGGAVGGALIEQKPETRDLSPEDALLERVKTTAKTAAIGAAGGAALRGVGLAGAAAAPTVLKNISKVAAKSKPIAEALKKAAKTTGAATGAIGGGTNRIFNASKSTLSDLGNTLSGNTIVLKNSLKRHSATGEAQIGLEIEELIGKKLTAAELTKDPTARAVERSVRTLPEKAEFFQNATIEKVDAGIDVLNKIATKFSVNPVNTQALTTGIRKAHQGAVDDVVKNRAAQASVEFEAAKAAGATGQFSLSSFNKTVNEILDLAKVKDPFESDIQIAKAVKKQLKKMFLDKSTQVKPVDVRRLQQMLEQWGRGATGKATFGLSDKSSETRISKMLFSALQRDLDTISESVTGTAGKLLKKARNNYRVNSLAIEALDNHALKTLLDGMGSKGLARGDEQIVDIVFRMAQKSGDTAALKSMIDLLELQSPQHLKELQKGVILRAIDQSVEAGRKSQTSIPIKVGGKEVRISPDVLSNNLPSPAASEILFPNQKGAQKEIELIFELMRRLTQSTGGSDSIAKGAGLGFVSKQGVIDKFINNLLAADDAAFSLLVDPNARKEWLKIGARNKNEAIEILSEVVR